MMMLSSIYVLSLSLILSSTGVISEEYSGFYDLSAKDTGYLCSLMPEYKKSGKQPDIINHPADDYPKEKYMKDDKCWKMRWNPCTEEDIPKTKPCGWYKMMEAPDSECP